MSAKPSFLECLLCDDLRQAFLGGQMVFVLSENLDDIIWANGSGASFLGFASISEAIGAKTTFDLATKRLIMLGLESARATQLGNDSRSRQARQDGSETKPQLRSFIFKQIKLSDDSTGIMAECVLDQLSQRDQIDLISGIADEMCEAGIVTLEGEILSQSANFTKLFTHSGYQLNGWRHSRLEKWQSHYQQTTYRFGSIRLSDNPPIFLIIASQLFIKSDSVTIANGCYTKINRPALVRKNDACDGLQNQPAGESISISNGENAIPNTNLNDAEKLAFREIAQRLRSELENTDVKLTGDSLKGEGSLQAGKNATPSNKSASTDHSSYFAESPAAFTTEDSETRAVIDDLASLLDLASDGIVILDRDGLILKMSHAALALSGLNDNEVCGLQFTELFDQDGRAIIRDYLYELTNDPTKALLNSGRDVNLHIRGGGTLPIFLTIMPLQSGRGFGVIMRDVSVRNNATELFLDQVINNQQSGLTPQLAHEIRTPLNAIIGFAELMRDERFGPIGNERYRGYIRDIVQSGSHIMGLLNDSLAKAKGDFLEPATNVHDNNERANISLALYDCLSLFKEQANSNGIIIRVSISTNIRSVRLSERIIKQVIFNLLSNSIRFTPSGGQIIISVVNIEPSLVQLRIKDTGFGMSADDLQRVLLPYEQIGRTDSRKGDLAFQGTGLGLTLVKSMVETNGGRFEISSKPGSGTIVTIVWPAS